MVKKSIPLIRSTGFNYETDDFYHKMKQKNELTAKIYLVVA